MTARSWTRTSPTSWRCEPWTISKANVRGGDTFALWHDDQPLMLDTFDSFNEAADAARRADNARAHLPEND